MVWFHVLQELRRADEVKLVTGGKADVWLASGHQRPPEGRPLVVQVHEASWIDQSLGSFLDPDLARGLDTATRASLAVAHRAITASQATREQISEALGYPRDRIEVVPHGVDHELFAPGITGGQGLVGAPYVLFVGVAHPRKNLAAVRQAVADLAGLGRPHALAIVGGSAPDRDAPEFERIASEELPGQPGRLRNFHRVPSRQLATLMAGADVFCLPSYFEGFGLPALEAMACGAPVVVSDRGALPEVVGDAGLVVAPDAASVSAAVQSVVTDADRMLRMRRASIERAAGFSWQRTAAGWLDALRAAA
jgi:glycosyltransferase involved in cell wall biosynthesis